MCVKLCLEQSSFAKVVKKNEIYKPLERYVLYCRLEMKIYAASKNCFAGDLWKY